MYQDLSQQSQQSHPLTPTESISSDSGKARLLSRGSSEPGTPTRCFADIEEKNYVLQPRPRLFGKRLRSVLAVIFATTFIIVVILAIVIGALVAKGEETNDNGTSASLTNGEVPSSPPLNDHTGYEELVKRAPPIANISCGSVLGTVQHDVYVFKGIPYAKNPNSSRRWMPPQPLDPPNQCWGPTMDTWNAEEFALPCYQYSRAEQRWIGSEDCLYLNVWSPNMSPGGKGLPVMVYIHGGGLMTGSGNTPGLSPTTALAKSANMVFVSFNYRLNVFGFLALDILSWRSNTGTSGNYGILDQIQALRWVQDNIAAFGGDPKQVTVFGEDSGATSIYALLGVPQAKGLFQRAWLASPSPKLEDSSTLSLAQKQNEAYYNSTGCSLLSTPKAAVECLQGMSAQKVGALVDWELWSNPHFHDLPTPGETSTILLLTNANGVKDFPIRAWKMNNFNDIPLLIGSMAQEVDVDPLPVDIASWDWNKYKEYITDKLGQFKMENMVPQALTHYGNKESPEYQFTSMVSDIRYIQPLHAVSQVVANVSKSPVYRYVSSFIPQDPIGNSTGRKNYSFGGMDMMAFFGSLKNISLVPANVANYSATIQQSVFAFARNGHIPRWGRFPDATIVISSHQESGTDCVVKSLGYLYKFAEYNFWRLHGLFPPYAAIN